MGSIAIDKAIDAVFEIIDDTEKVKKMDALATHLVLDTDFFSFSCFLNINQNRLVTFLDWYFYELIGHFHPDNDLVGGLASYALYDAAMPYIDGVPYNLKNKDEFREYVTQMIDRKGQNQ